MDLVKELDFTSVLSSWIMSKILMVITNRRKNLLYHPICNLSSGCTILASQGMEVEVEVLIWAFNQLTETILPECHKGFQKLKRRAAQTLLYFTMVHDCIMTLGPDHNLLDEKRQPNTSRACKTCRVSWTTLLNQFDAPDLSGVSQFRAYAPFPCKPWVHYTLGQSYWYAGREPCHISMTCCAYQLSKMVFGWRNSVT